MTDSLEQRIDAYAEQQMGKLVDRFGPGIERKVEQLNLYFADKETLVYCIIHVGWFALQTGAFSACIAADLITRGQAHAMAHAARNLAPATKKRMFDEYKRARRFTDIFDAI